MQENTLQGTLEAVLFAAGDPVPMDQLRKILEIKEEAVEDLLRQLSETLAERKRDRKSVV